MARKTKFDSAAGKVDTAAAEQGLIEPPAYCDPLKGEARLKWDAYIRGRTEWREVDLATLYEVVYLDGEIDRLKEELAKAGDVDFSGQGAPMANPLHSILDRKMAARLAHIRGMALNMSTQEGKNLNNSGVKAKAGPPAATPKRKSVKKKPPTQAEKKAKALSLVK